MSQKETQTAGIRAITYRDFQSQRPEGAACNNRSQVIIARLFAFQKVQQNRHGRLRGKSRQTTATTTFRQFPEALRQTEISRSKFHKRIDRGHYSVRVQLGQQAPRLGSDTTSMPDRPIVEPTEYAVRSPLPNDQHQCPE